MNAWERGFQAAKAVREFSDDIYPGLRLGAALFSGPALISVGCNTYSKTHPKARTYKYNKTIHAEHAAVIRRQYLSNKNMIMYVYRENGNGEPVCSKPCSSCQKIMRLAGIRRVRYINESGLQEEMKLQ